MQSPESDLKEGLKSQYETKENLAITLIIIK